MNVLKLFNIARITPKTVFTAFGTLLLFGVATNGLYDLWKLIPTVNPRSSPDWEGIICGIGPILIFAIWIFYVYKKLALLVTQRSFSAGDTEVVSPHRGIVLALSKPKKSAEDINKIIEKTNMNNIETLYDEWSIGQLFKGLYHHKAAPLRYVWLITTKDSLPYCTCIEAFLNKFIPSAQICGRDGMNGICHLAEGGDLELIERTKSILSSIYSQTYLEDFGLTKSDIVVDITGGTKSITIGLIFGALDSVIDIQYVEQQSKRYAVVPLAITLEIILDKAGEYLINLYSKMYEGRKE